MNRVANSAIKYKSRMWYKYRQSRSYSDLVEYRVAQNKAVKEFRKANQSTTFMLYYRTHFFTNHSTIEYRMKQSVIVNSSAELCIFLLLLFSFDVSSRTVNWQKRKSYYCQLTDGSKSIYF